MIAPLLLAALATAPADAGALDFVVVGEARPVFLRVRIEVGGRPFRASSETFRLVVAPPADRRTDALFDRLDRDQDGAIGRAELDASVASLRKLDRDADELIGADEVAPTAAMSGRTARASTAAPTIIERDPDESPVRPARALLRAYDAGSTRGASRRDARLSPEEFAIPPPAFADADADRDGLLNVEEIRAYLADVGPDVTLDVAFSGNADGHASVVAHPARGGPSPIVRQLADGVVEIDVGLVRLDIHVDDGAGALDSARRTLRARFDLDDTDGNGSLDADELAGENGQPSPLAAVSKAIDRDGDGQLTPAELDAYAATQALAARGRLTLSATDEGRALFGLLDLDRDRRLGAREVLHASARVAACDRDRDGRVSPEEIPHHIRLVFGRGDLSALLAPPPARNGAVAIPRMAPAPARPSVGPSWFRKMDRNRDGDVSRREFLGPRDRFDRLDLDRDGLLSPDEAARAGP